MMLFESMQQSPERMAEIAANWAEYIRHDTEADRAEIVQELAEILKRRADLAAQAERLAEEIPTICTAWEDFAGVPGAGEVSQPTPQDIEQERNERKKEAQKGIERFATDIADLDRIFSTICRALDVEGLTLSGGEISALKRLKMPDTLAAEIDNIKRDKIASLPAGERLSGEEAAALYGGLLQIGLISGNFATFCYYFGAFPLKKPLNFDLFWAGTAAQFAYFIEQFSEYQGKKAVKLQIPWRIKALCRAFGIDERRRLNVIIPALYDKKKKATRGGEQIKAIFETLPGLNENNKIQQL